MKVIYVNAENIEELARSQQLPQQWHLVILMVCI